MVVKLKLKICERGSTIKSGANFKKKASILSGPATLLVFNLFSALLTSEIDTNTISNEPVKSTPQAVCGPKGAFTLVRPAFVHSGFRDSNKEPAEIKMIIKTM